MKPSTALYSLGFSRPGDQLYRQATISALLWALGAVALGYSARAELGLVFFPGEPRPPEPPLEVKGAVLTAALVFFTVSARLRLRIVSKKLSLVYTIVAAVALLGLAFSILAGQLLYMGSLLAVPAALEALYWARSGE